MENNYNIPIYNLVQAIPYVDVMMQSTTFKA